MRHKVLLIVGKNQPLGSLLREKGYQLLEAKDFSQAAALLGRQLPDLLLLDAGQIEQTGANGLEALRRSCRDKQIPCWLYASRNDPSQNLKELAPWTAGSIQNPDNPDEVIYKVESQLALQECRSHFQRALQKALAEKRELAECLKSAVTILKSLAPHHPPNIEALGFAWRFLPCGNVGGDMFNVARLDENTVMAYILDVSGHGFSSAMVTVSISQSLSPQVGEVVKRALTVSPYYEIVSPAEVLYELDRQYPFERFESFFTICYLLIDIKTGRVRHSNAGHPPPVLLRKDGTLKLLREGGTIIGLGELIPFVESEARLEVGDKILLYTDGILEYPNMDGELFGKERFYQKLEELAGESIEKICDGMSEAVKKFASGKRQQDDVTLFGIEYRGMAQE